MDYQREARELLKYSVVRDSLHELIRARASQCIKLHKYSYDTMYEAWQETGNTWAELASVNKKPLFKELVRQYVCDQLPQARQYRPYLDKYIGPDGQYIIPARSQDPGTIREVKIEATFSEHMHSAVGVGITGEPTIKSARDVMEEQRKKDKNDYYAMMYGGSTRSLGGVNYQKIRHPRMSDSIPKNPCSEIKLGKPAVECVLSHDFSELEKRTMSMGYKVDMDAARVIYKDLAEQNETAAKNFFMGVKPNIEEWNNPPNESTNELKEKNMIKLTTEIKLNGQLIEHLTHEAILEYIVQIEKDLADLRAIVSTSSYVANQIKENEKTLKAIVKILDAKPKA